MAIRASDDQPPPTTHKPSDASRQSPLRGPKAFSRPSIKPIKLYFTDALSPTPETRDTVHKGASLSPRQLRVRIFRRIFGYGIPWNLLNPNGSCFIAETAGIGSRSNTSRSEELMREWKLDVETDGLPNQLLIRETCRGTKFVVLNKPRSLPLHTV